MTGAERSALLPDVPSMAEAGFPAVDVHLWSGVFAPAATPPAVVAKLEKALDETIRDPGVADKLKALAVDPGGATPEQFKPSSRATSSNSAMWSKPRTCISRNN